MPRSSRCCHPAFPLPFIYLFIYLDVPAHPLSSTDCIAQVAINVPVVMLDDERVMEEKDKNSAARQPLGRRAQQTA